MTINCLTSNRSPNVIKHLTKIHCWFPKMFYKIRQYSLQCFPCTYCVTVYARSWLIACGFSNILNYQKVFVLCMWFVYYTYWDINATIPRTTSQSINRLCPISERREQTSTDDLILCEVVLRVVALMSW
jgi:hypothetical protein